MKLNTKSFLYMHSNHSKLRFYIHDHELASVQPSIAVDQLLASLHAVEGHLHSHILPVL